jgi:hypothetical protein
MAAGAAHGRPARRSGVLGPAFPPSLVRGLLPPFPGLSGTTAMTARVIADHSPAGVSRPARLGRHRLLRRPPPPASSSSAARQMRSALGDRAIPARNATVVPGSFTSPSRRLIRGTAGHTPRVSGVAGQSG